MLHTNNNILFFFGAEVMIKLMSETGYDAAALCNHDFDAGTDELVKQLSGLKFPFVNCYYNFSDTLLHDKILQHKKISV